MTPVPNVLEEIELQRRLVGVKKVGHGWDFSQYYHQWYNAQLLGLLVPGPEFAVLDCGCGSGILLPSLEKRYKRIIGLDLSIDHLLEAREQIYRANLLAGDIARLPLRAQSFDHVVCRTALHRLPDVRLAFRLLFAVLKQGGDLIVSEPIGDSRVVRFLQVIIKRRTSRHYKAKEWKYTSQDWIQMAEAAGFRTVRWFNLGYVALPLLGYPEDSYIMPYIPYRMTVARWLLRLDGLLANIPWINAQSWHAVFHFKKPPACRSHSSF